MSTSCIPTASGRMGIRQGFDIINVQVSRSFGRLASVVTFHYRVDLAIEQQGDVFCKIFALLCFVFLGTVPIPYVQVAILNLPLPKLKSTTVLLYNLFVYCWSHH